MALVSQIMKSGTILNLFYNSIVKIIIIGQQVISTSQWGIENLSRWAY